MVAVETDVLDELSWDPGVTKDGGGMCRASIGARGSSCLNVVNVTKYLKLVPPTPSFAR